jgi:dTDP-glucose pyrophosphorylase
MKGIILAAGKGSRLAELNLQHKSFAVVHKKHVIDFNLDLLVGDEAHPLVNEIIIVVGYHAEVIIEYIGDDYKGVPVKYVYQHELKGVAHAVLVSKDELDDDFIMCLADEIMMNPRIADMIKYFEESDATCVCGAVIDGEDFSMKPIAYDIDKDNNVLRVTEKPKEYHNTIRGIGECIFKKDALNYLDVLQPNPIRGELEMGDWIQMAVDDHKVVKVFDLADGYINVNYAKDIEAANKLLEKVALTG